LCDPDGVLASAASSPAGVQPAGGRLAELTVLELKADPEGLALMQRAKK
jgi:hypothetical protein